METNLYSISKIFTERILRIPDYQRGYAWTEKQLKDFWNDIEQLEENANHYVGVLTLENVDKEFFSTWIDDLWIIESKSYEPFYIVDGQQRLTTSIILIQAIIDTILDGQKLNYSSRDEIQKKYIFESKDDGISRSYLFGYEKDNPSYEFLKTRIFGEKSTTSDIQQETIYTNNLFFAKEFFIKKLQEVDFSLKEKIFKKITQNFLFNIYVMSTDVDVYVAFETMNNRGKPLSHLELLKNRLIFLSTKLNNSSHDIKKLRNAINECWKTIYHQLGRNKDKPLEDDLFLESHFIMYFDDDGIAECSNLYRDIYRRGRNSAYQDYLLEQLFTTRKIFDSSIDTSYIYKYVQSLKESVELWYELLNPQESNFSQEEIYWLEKINKIGIFGCLPLILVYFISTKKEDANKRVKLLKTLEKILFINTFPSNFYNRVDYISIATELRKENTTSEKIITQLNDILQNSLQQQNLKDYSSCFKERGFYQWNGIRYFLYEYDLYLSEKSKTVRNKINWSEYNNGRGYYYNSYNDYSSIEHILPQNGRKDCWIKVLENYSSDEKKIIKNALGNLVPLSKAKNSSLGNECFFYKIENPNHDSVGFRYGSYSENELTKYEQWTTKEILIRSVKLIKFMNQRWHFNIGDNRVDKIINFLKLDFILKKENLRIDNEKII